MNQDKLKEILCNYSEDKSFFVIFSGKASKKVNGLYHAASCEIIIHNKNFSNDNELMYTALHELAHHIDYCKNKKSSHSGDFPSILAKITEAAINDGNFKSLPPDENRKIIEGNKVYAAALKAFGMVLKSSHDYCINAGYPFSDVIERILRMKRSEAYSLMSMAEYDIPTELGGEFGRRVAKIKNPDKRKEAAVLKEIQKSSKSNLAEVDEYAALRLEKKRLERTIESLSHRLEEIDLKLEQAETTSACSA